MNEMKPEDVMKALEICGDRTQTCYYCPYTDHCNDCHKDALALLREKDAEIKELTDDNKWSAKRIIETDRLVSLLKAENERLTQERDDARRDCAIAEQLHYECKKELEEMSDDILDSVRAERDRYKAESEQYQTEMLKRGEEIERVEKDFWGSQADIKMRLADARAEAITEFAERLKTFYKHLPGNTVGGSVEYHIDQVVKEMREKL